MSGMRNWKVGAAVVVGAVFVGAGGAVAAGKLISPGERSQAVVSDAAEQLGVEPAKLTAALKKALENQIDADVAAGRMTKEHGEAMKKRIEAGNYPLLDVGPRGGFGHGELPRRYRGAAQDGARRREEPRRHREGQGEVRRWARRRAHRRRQREDRR